MKWSYSLKLSLGDPSVMFVKIEVLAALSKFFAKVEQQGSSLAAWHQRQHGRVAPQ
jgi:hypothetical protein